MTRHEDLKVSGACVHVFETRYSACMRRANAPNFTTSDASSVLPQTFSARVSNVCKHGTEVRHVAYASCPCSLVSFQCRASPVHPCSFSPMIFLSLPSFVPSFPIPSFPPSLLPFHSVPVEGPRQQSSHGRSGSCPPLLAPDARDRLRQSTRFLHSRGKICKQSASKTVVNDLLSRTSWRSASPFESLDARCACERAPPFVRVCVRADASRVEVSERCWFAGRAQTARIQCTCTHAHSLACTHKDANRYTSTC